MNFNGEILFLPRRVQDEYRSESATVTNPAHAHARHITRFNTFIIFNMLLVHHEPGSSYGLLRVFQIIGSANPHHHLCLWYLRRQADDKMEAWIVPYLAGACSQLLKLLISSAINVTLAVHEDEYKSVS